MKVSYNWLRDYINITQSPDKLSEILTNLGLEIGSLEETGGIPGNLEGIVVGHILSAEQHPNADRLRVTQVDVGGDEPLHIVCGAPNVAKGQKVPVAMIGAELHPISGEPFKIKKGKIRGEVSMGMICAEDEIGLGSSHDGIMVLDSKLKPGTPLNQVIKQDKDYVLEIDLTPNRIDAASHYGVARDLGATLKKKAKLPESKLDLETLTEENPIPVSIEDPERCKRYTSIYIRGVEVKESPEWLKKRITAIGLRPINSVVDITNYVLMELGQPMHAFDADQVKGKKILVKTLTENTKFETLDELERELIAGQDLMICDTEKPLCIAGVMGGINSGVTFDTKNIFLEVAYFEPVTVRKTAKRLGIHSDSSFRYERGADPNMTVTTALRAASLIQEIAGGTVSKLNDIKLSDFPPFEVDLSLRHMRKLIGKNIPRREVIRILTALDIEVTPEVGNLDLLHLKVPPYRVDVQRSQDVIEEVLRVHGYNNVAPSSNINASLDFKSDRNTFALRQRYCDYLSANGYYEILNNSLVNAKLGDDKAVPMLNPLSEDQSIMRQSMLPGALEAVQWNQNRQEEDLAFYEFGKTYEKAGDGYKETEWLTILVTGQKHSTHWAEKSPKVSLYTLTREMEKLQHWFNFHGKLEESRHDEFDFGLDLITKKKDPVLQYGKVKADLADTYELRNEVYYMRIDWQQLVELYYDSTITFHEIPQYPSIRRDISMIIDDVVSFADIRSHIEKANPKLIRSVELHDVYKGKGIAEGKKSYLVSFVLRDDNKSMASKAADKLSEIIYKTLEKETGAEIRR